MKCICFICGNHICRKENCSIAGESSGMCCRCYIQNRIEKAVSKNMCFFCGIGLIGRFCMYCGRMYG